MNTHTITAATAATLCRIRRTQTKDARTAIDALNAAASPGRGRKWWTRRRVRKTEPHTVARCARVRFVNGITVDGVIRADIMAAWLKLTPGKRAEIKVGPDSITLSREGGSRVTLYVWQSLELGASRNRRDVPAMAFGSPITLTAPHDGGEFRQTDVLPLP